MVHCSPSPFRGRELKQTQMKTALPLRRVVLLFCRRPVAVHYHIIVARSAWRQRVSPINSNWQSCRSASVNKHRATTCKFIYMRPLNNLRPLNKRASRLCQTATFFPPLRTRRKIRSSCPCAPPHAVPFSLPSLNSKGLFLAVLIHAR